MRYLFFDIECANCFNGNGKICSFGYVLTDTKFRVLDKRDILINPRSKFHLRGAKDGIELAYPEEVFRSQPDFKHFYSEIRELLTARDQIVFGHSVANDVGFIRSDCVRYNLPPINYEFYDGQILFQKITNRQRNISLESINEYFGYNTNESVLHKSDDDAYVTMLSIKSMAEKMGMPIEELIKLCPACYGKIENGIISHKVLSKKEVQRKIQQDIENTVKGKANTEGKFNGKRFSFALDIEGCIEVFKLYIKALYENGGTYTIKTNDCNCYVEGKKYCFRTNNIYVRNKKFQNILILNQEEFRDAVGISREDYDKAIDRENEFRRIMSNQQSTDLIRLAKEKGIYEEDEEVKSKVVLEEVSPIYEGKNPNLINALQEFIDRKEVQIQRSNKKQKYNNKKNYNKNYQKKPKAQSKNA